MLLTATTITNIASHVQQLQGHGRFQRIMRVDYVKGIIQILNKELDDAAQLFGVCADLR